MDAKGHVLLFLAVTLLILGLVLAISEYLGKKAGIWVVKKHFRSWPQTNISELPWWGMLVAVVIVETIITYFVSVECGSLKTRLQLPKVGD